jgi:hypothetical protein
LNINRSTNTSSNEKKVSLAMLIFLFRKIDKNKLIKLKELEIQELKESINEVY